MQHKEKRKETKEKKETKKISFNSNSFKVLFLGFFLVSISVEVSVSVSVLGTRFRFRFRFNAPTARCARYQRRQASTLYSIYSHLAGGNIDLNANQCNKTFFFDRISYSICTTLSTENGDESTTTPTTPTRSVSLFLYLSLPLSLWLLGWLSKSTEVHVALSTMKIGS